MIPAAALAAELVRRGHAVTLVTDARGARFDDLFDDVVVEVLPAGRYRGLRTLPATLAQIWAGRGRARDLIRDFAPEAVIGFGGYPALPTVLAALSLKLPTALHEQNAVLGRTNRMLARFVTVVATAYRRVDRLPRGIEPAVVGNPVRADILALRDQPYPPLSDDGYSFALLRMNRMGVWDEFGWSEAGASAVCGVSSGYILLALAGSG